MSFLLKYSSFKFGAIFVLFLLGQGCQNGSSNDSQPSSQGILPQQGNVVNSGGNQQGSNNNQGGGQSAEFMVLSAGSGMDYEFSVEEGRTYHFEALTRACSNGVCCSIETPQQNLGHFSLFARGGVDVMAGTADASNEIHFLIEARQTGIVTINVSGFGGNACHTTVPRITSHAATVESSQDVAAIGLFHQFNVNTYDALPVSQIGERLFLRTIAARNNGLASSSAIETHVAVYHPPSRGSQANSFEPYFRTYVASGERATDIPNSAIDLHAGSVATLEYLKEELGINSVDNRGGSMFGLVDFPFPWDEIEFCGIPREPNSLFNAFFLGPFIATTAAVSSRTTVPFSAALDVIAHEWGHALESGIGVDLAYQRESGALSGSIC